ncbi:hypothetical protein [Parageobacillus galactosidasius]|uniref:hypothetical protein n=1 Tax=Parageobacillus galactosidasius TaxID=883812 RepID=UPI000B5C4CD8|nr:hypothetical protein [Parageobacillus galactosidasius]
MSRKDEQLDLFHEQEKIEKPISYEKPNLYEYDVNKQAWKKVDLEAPRDVCDPTETEDIEKPDAQEHAVDEPEMIQAPSGEMYTKEEWESPVFANGPTRKEVEAWKEKYGQVYFTPFEDLIVIWRTLSRPEYREIVRNQDLTMLDREEIIADKCVLFPYDFSCKKYTENGRAGIPSLLTEMIMDKSGFIAKTAPIKL